MRALQQLLAERDIKRSSCARLRKNAQAALGVWLLCGRAGLLMARSLGARRKHESPHLLTQSAWPKNCRRRISTLRSSERHASSPSSRDCRASHWTRSRCVRVPRWDRDLDV